MDLIILEQYEENSTVSNKLLDQFKQDGLYSIFKKELAQYLSFHNKKLYFDILAIKF